MKNKTLPRLCSCVTICIWNFKYNTSLLFSCCLACRWPSDTNSVPEQPAWNAKTSVKASSCISGGLWTFFIRDVDGKYGLLHIYCHLMSFFQAWPLMLWWDNATSLESKHITPYFLVMTQKSATITLFHYCTAQKTTKVSHSHACTLLCRHSNPARFPSRRLQVLRSPPQHQNKRSIRC